MRVLLQGRGQRTELRGGDSAVVSRLGRELERLGHDVEVLPQPPQSGARGYDVVHAINLDRSVLAYTERFARAAQVAGVRFVLTPLWWPLGNYVRSMAPVERWAFRAKGSRPVRALKDREASSLRGLRHRQAGVLAAAQAICPSGSAEGEALKACFGSLPVQVVHFGTDFRAAAHAGEPASPERTGVLCVGRIDPRKNQAGLIRAIHGTGINLTLVGTDRVFPAYAAACQAAVAGPGVTFLGYLPTPELEAAYRSARVHALPSYFELPGLTSLDAAVLGAGVVVARDGTPEEYFGHQASYCRQDPASIREAVLAAYEAGPPDGLAQRVSEEFTWQATARGYERAYG